MADIKTYLTEAETAAVEAAQSNPTPATAGLLEIVQRLTDGLASAQTAPSVPADPNADPAVPNDAEPAMSDKDCLEYLASTVLGDLESTGYLVVEKTQRAVRRTGRSIGIITGD